MIKIDHFKYVVEGLIVPQVSLVGLLANTLTIVVLNHREVKLKKSLVDILCGLATFDNLFLLSIFPMFTLPVLSEWYLNVVFPYVAPYLLPALNTLMTCSVYATVAVAMNRYVEMTDGLKHKKWLKSGKIQCIFVLLFSVLFNLSRWFELEYVVTQVKQNEGANATFLEDNATTNVTRVTLKATALRVNEKYIRWYSCITTSIVMIVIPTTVLAFSSYKVTKILNTSASAALGALNDDRCKARIKRNQSITRMLIGIIVMFLICHTGKIVISFYEVFLILFYNDAPFQPWAKHLIVVNSLLCTINSSCNFAFYCGDVVFRECLSAVSRAGCKQADIFTKCFSKANPQTNTQMNPEEMALRSNISTPKGSSGNLRKQSAHTGENNLAADLDPQSKLLLGIPSSCTKVIEISKGDSRIVA